MHRTEGPDYVTTGGKKLYTGTAPGTLINTNAMNAIQEEICMAVEAAGLTLRASGAADVAGVWGQLLTAIKTLSGRGGGTGVDNPSLGFMLGTTGAVAKAVSANPMAITAISGYISLSAESGGPFADGVINLEESSTYANRFILVSNFTGTRKRVKSSSLANTYSTLIENHAAAWFYYLSGTGWLPVRPPMHETTDTLTEGSTNKYFSGKTQDDLGDGSIAKQYNKSTGTFSMTIKGEGGSVFDTATATWVLVDDIVDLIIPPFSGVTGINLAIGDFLLLESLPADIRPAASRFFPLCYQANSNYTVTQANAFYVANTKIGIRLMDTVNGVSTTVTTHRQMVRYCLAS